MKRLNLHDVYVFGKSMSPLSSIEHDDAIQTKAFALWIARNQLSRMVGDRSPLLPTARRAAGKLLNAINEVIPAGVDELMEMDKAATFNWVRANAITDALKEMESVLSNDMPGIAAYLVSKKGIYSTDDLVASAELALLPTVREMLPEQAIGDLQDAGRCLAYELGTACAFHLWRAVETAVAVYYQALTKSSFSADKVQRNWGAYIRALEKKGADPKITTFLEHVKDNYRNPQTHPDEVVAIDEAQALFGVALTSIHQLIAAARGLTPVEIPEAGAGLLGLGLADLASQATDEDNT